MDSVAGQGVASYDMGGDAKACTRVLARLRGTSERLRRLLIGLIGRGSHSDSLGWRSDLSLLVLYISFSPNCVFGWWRREVRPWFITKNSPHSALHRPPLF